MVKDV